MSTSTFIVLAHPEPRSFNGCWARASRDACVRLGHTVFFSDLVGEGFNPVESAQQYIDSDGWSPGLPFDPLRAQASAAQDGSLAPDVAVAVEHLQKADRLVIHFPLWWFGPPAVLKGWFDRCFVHGALHTVEERFDLGRCRGKKALFCVSTGASQAECSFAGKEGDVGLLLWPLAYTLRYLGFTVLKPQLVHGVHGYVEGEEKVNLDNRLAKIISDQDRVMSGLDKLPQLSFNADADFDEKGQLKPESKSYSAFIRHIE